MSGWKTGQILTLQWNDNFKPYIICGPFEDSSSITKANSINYANTSHSKFLKMSAKDFILKVTLHFNMLWLVILS